MSYRDEDQAAHVADEVRSHPYWTPDVLLAYDRYRVCVPEGNRPMVVLRLDGWQVGMRWCMTTEEACHELNERGATPITSHRFRKGTMPRKGDGWFMDGRRDNA